MSTFKCNGLIGSDFWIKSSFNQREKINYKWSCSVTSFLNSHMQKSKLMKRETWQQNDWNIVSYYLETPVFQINTVLVLSLVPFPYKTTFFTTATKTHTWWCIYAHLMTGRQCFEKKVISTRLYSLEGSNSRNPWKISCLKSPDKA